MIQHELDGMRWELQPDFAPLLESVLKSAGETVKESPVKRVTRHRIDRGVYYIKRYFHHAVPLRPIKFLFKATQARQEWTLAAQLEARQIPIVRHVALGERRSWRGIEESILVTEGFDGLPLDQIPYVDPLIVLRFVERMHDRGVVQMDLHPANLLMNRAASELRMVDLHGTRVRTRLSADERETSLALLRMYYPIPVTTEIEQRSRVLRKRLLHERSRRCLRNNREFAVQRHGGLKWRVRLPLMTEMIRRILTDPDDFLEHGAIVMKRGGTSTVGKAGGVVLKRFNFRKIQSLAKDLFRPSRAQRAFQKAYHLELTGVPTARPVATACRRSLGVLTASYLLMEEIKGAVDLSAWSKARHPVTRVLLLRAAEVIAKLHEEGFSHRDLKLSNLVLDEEGGLRVLDLDGLRFWGEVPPTRAAADLERLARSAHQKMQLSPPQIRSFVRAYCRSRGLKKFLR